MYQHILVPLDESRLAETALARACALARPGHTRLTLLRVLEPPEHGPHGQPVDPVGWELEVARASSYLAAKAADLPSAGLDVECVVTQGDPALTIAATAAERAVDLVALASHGVGGVSGHDLGSVACKAALRLKTHLLLVRVAGPGQSEAPGQVPAAPPGAPVTTASLEELGPRAGPQPAGLIPLRFTRVMVALDGSPRAEVAIPHALRAAEASSASLELVHVCADRPTPLPGFSDEDARTTSEDCLQPRTLSQAADRYLARIAEDLSGYPGELETCVLRTCDVSAALHDRVIASGADLLVMSAHGRTGSGRWRYGGRTLNMLLYGTASVLVVQDRAAAELQASPAEVEARERKGH